MSEVTRRTMLVGAGLTGAALAVPAWAHGQGKPALAVFDSNLPQAAAFARECEAAGIRLLDIAREDANLWRTCRDGFGVAPGARIVGMTGWSDWVMLRGLLHAQRRRVEREDRVEAGNRTVFAWAAA